jgi:uncharacterized glyoxalase superfamily protein PhnB
MTQNTNTLSLNDYKEIFFDSINSENISMADYLFSKYVLYKDTNPRFAYYIKSFLDEAIRVIKSKLESSNKKKNNNIAHVEFVMSHNDITPNITMALKSTSSNKNFITTIDKIHNGYSDFVVLIGDGGLIEKIPNKLKWGGNKIQLNYLLHHLKKMSLVNNTYESLALFLIENIDIYDGDNKQTIMDDLKNGKYPKRGVNLDDLLKELN